MVSFRMPVLRQEDVVEVVHQLVRDRDDLISVGYGQTTARAKIVLNVNYQKCSHRSARNSVGLCSALIRPRDARDFEPGGRPERHVPSIAGLS